MSDEAAATPEAGKSAGPAPALPIKLLIIVVAAALIAAVVLNRSVRSDAEFAAQSATASTDLRGAVAGGSRSAVTDAVLGPDSTEFLIAMAVDR